MSKEFYILNKNKTDFINLVKKQVQKADSYSREIYTENSEQGILKKFVSRILHKNLLLTAFARFSYYYFLKLAFLDGTNSMVVTGIASDITSVSGEVTASSFTHKIPVKVQDANGNQESYFLLLTEN